jgi:hypothetical protein
MGDFLVGGAALVAALLSGGPASAQTRTPPGWHETQLWVAGVASKPAVLVGGLGLAWRDAGRTRLSFALGGGVTEDHRAAGRAEITWHFLLDPAQRRKLSVYGGGGLALSIMEGDRVRPWIQLALGAETAPAGRAGWFIEAGFGGGARVATGIRWRRRARA